MDTKNLKGAELQKAAGTWLRTLGYLVHLATPTRRRFTIGDKILTRNVNEDIFSAFDLMAMRSFIPRQPTWEKPILLIQTTTKLDDKHANRIALLRNQIPFDTVTVGILWHQDHKFHMAVLTPEGNWQKLGPIPGW